MTLKEFLKNLNKMAKDFPETLDMEVITSRDDEGNGYNKVHYTPCVGRYDEGSDMLSGDGEFNAVCVN